MPIGPTLILRGVINDQQLGQAIAESRSSGERLDRVIVRLGLASRQDVLAAVGEQFHMPVVDLASCIVEPAVLGMLPATLVFRQRCVPISKEGGSLRVATSDPYEIASLDELRLLTGCSIETVLADEEELQKFIRANYGVGGDTLDAMSQGQAASQVEAKPVDESDQAQEASVIRLVNDLLAEAISERATDVHIEPYEHELAVRYRIDGVLQRANVPATIHRFGAAIVSRLKIMANLNIAEKRKPQDGRITFRHRPPQGGAAQEYDLRMSVIPMLFGEGVVLRVLSKTAVLMSLEDLGMPEGVKGKWATLIERPHGIVLVTGPTGSGKSTTLYASLNRIVSDEIKVITVEDPVEYHVRGVNQIQVNTQVGLSFASGLRSILRHDPDVVMIGEIRDKETAETAVQASLTGHLVFSTLHTNDAAGSVTRLLDMGVEPFLVASSLEGVLAQRLVRRICRECGESYEPDPADLPPALGLAPGATLMRGRGCRACRQTGYRGRLGVYELLRLSEATRHMVMERTAAPAIAAAATREDELSTLLQDGFTKVREGKTTLAEVLSAMSE
ncbi:MAG: GspE/PulE family protein [Phycisphaerae bacterium]|jgi:general secretion pathway protein E/type IV pilus assembly protein PilB